MSDLPRENLRPADLGPAPKPSLLDEDDLNMMTKVSSRKSKSRGQASPKRESTLAPEYEPPAEREVERLSPTTKLASSKKSSLGKSQAMIEVPTVVEAPVPEVEVKITPVDQEKEKLLERLRSIGRTEEVVPEEEPVQRISSRRPSVREEEEEIIEEIPSRKQSRKPSVKEEEFVSRKTTSKSKEPSVREEEKLLSRKTPSAKEERKSPEEKIEEVVRKSSERKVSTPDDELEAELSAIYIPKLLAFRSPANKLDVNWNNARAIEQLDKISERLGKPESIRSDANGMALWESYREFEKLKIHDNSHVHLYPWPHFDIVCMSIKIDLDEKQQRKLAKISQALSYDSADDILHIRTDSFESAVGLAVIVKRFARGRVRPHEARHLMVLWADQAKEDPELLEALATYLSEV